MLHSALVESILRVSGTTCKWYGSYQRKEELVTASDRVCNGSSKYEQELKKHASNKIVKQLNYQEFVNVIIYI